MNKVILGLVLGLALGAAGAVILVKYPKVAEYLRLSEAEKEAEPEAPAEDSFVQHDAAGRTVIKLDHDTQTRMGLKVAVLAAAQAPAEVRGFGRVLDPTPLVALVAERASALAALQASTKEYERVKTLYSQDQNASARALETAEAAMNKDRIALESARLRLLTGWGQEIASRPDLEEFVTALAARRTALVRVDVPLGENPTAPPAGVRLAPVAAPENALEAQILGPAPTTDPQVQTEGYLVLAKTDAGIGGQGSGAGMSLAPGAALVAWLTVPGPVRSGVIVPREAVLRHQGETFVYLQEDNAFQRQAVTLERPIGNGWFVTGGASPHSSLQPQEKVVVVGAQQLLSEELKGQGGEEE